MSRIKEKEGKNCGPRYVPPHLRSGSSKNQVPVQLYFSTPPRTKKNQQIQENGTGNGQSKFPPGVPEKVRPETHPSAPSPVGDTWEMGYKLPPLPQLPIHERLKNMNISISSAPTTGTSYHHQAKHAAPSRPPQDKSVGGLGSIPYSNHGRAPYRRCAPNPQSGPPPVSNFSHTTFYNNNVPNDHHNFGPSSSSSSRYELPASVYSADYGATVPGGLPVEKWFASKFCTSKAAYDIFKLEFQSIVQKKVPQKQWPPFLEPINKQRRVQSKEFTVNAHWVEGMHGKYYIACEGPNPSSVYDFWEMVWQEKVSGILMLNQPYEERLFPKTYNAAHETIQYWPLKEKETKNFAPWKITCLWTKLKHSVAVPPDGSEPPEGYSYRVTKISLVESNPITSPKPREIIHICYYRWPDGQIPAPLPGDGVMEYAPTADVLTDVLQGEFRDVKGPLVIHCHAGVGRTGVAMAVDMAATRLRNKSFADVRETVRWIREQRPRAVMNVWQYTYINLCLAQLAVRESHLPKTMHISGKKKRSHHTQVTCAQMLDECWRDMTEDFRKICYPEDGDDDQDGFEDDFDDQDDMSLVKFDVNGLLSEC